MITLPTRARGGDLVRDKVFSLLLVISPGECAAYRCLRGDTLARPGIPISLFKVGM